MSYAYAYRLTATHKQFTMQAVAVAIAKATWAWVRGKCEEAMREVLGAGRGIQAGEVLESTLCVYTAVWLQPYAYA